MGTASRGMDRDLVHTSPGRRYARVGI